MAMGRSAERKGEAFWRRALKRRAKSGMTIAEFCASEGLKTTTYHYWQREIKRRDDESPPKHMPVSEKMKNQISAGALRDDESQSQHMPVGDGQLVPVQVVDDQAMAVVEIVASNGFVIRVSEQASTEHLKRVLQAVDELS